MNRFRSLLGIASGFVLLSLSTGPVLADGMTPVGSTGPVRPGNLINVGDSMNIAIGPQTGGGELFHMDYPGGFQPAVINARIDGVPQLLTSTVGFDVFDAQNGLNPVEHVTLATNQFNNDPALMEFVYTSNFAGPITVQFFNWSGAPLTLQVMPVQLPGVPLAQTGPTIPGSATAVGISSVAGVTISRG
ncbi:MAG: hypothetical protein JOZ39_03355 [Chloroflexi bacterium]|nr:hypothetical protein [Chloroflexota bacterium]